MTFKIEKDVPPPEQRAKYPFATMDIGDSFFASGKTTSNLLSAAKNHRTDGRKWTARTENGGARIWRVA